MAIDTGGSQGATRLRPVVLRNCCLRSGHPGGGFSGPLTVIGLVASERVND